MEKLVRQIILFLKRNSSTVLTCVGAVGVIATSVFAVKATPKARMLIDEAEEVKGESLTKLEVVKVAGPAYAPAVITGTATIACIFGANVLNKRSQAALASAYALLDNSYKEYKKKVEELYGEEASAKVREELANDAFEEHPIEVSNDKQLFYDMYSDRYFESTMQKVLEAQYNLNRSFATKGYAYLNEFYDYLEIEPIPSGYKLGWSKAQCLDMHCQSWIDFNNELIAIGSDDPDYEGLECCVISIMTDPIVGFEDY